MLLFQERTLFLDAGVDAVAHPVAKLGLQIAVFIEAERFTFPPKKIQNTTD